MTDVGFTFLENPLRTEDFSLALPEDGQQLGSSHGSRRKLISNEGFSWGIRDEGRAERKRDSA
jgi:hypothetical protein